MLVQRFLDGSHYLAQRFCKVLRVDGLGNQPRGFEKNAHKKQNKHLTRFKSVYNPTCLEWHQGDEQCCKPRRFLCGLVVRQASLLTLFNRLAVALAKSQDHRASCGVFSFGRPSDSRNVTGPAWAAKSENTDTATHPAACRPALIERLVKDWVQRWKQGPFYKRINPSSALGFFVVLDELRRNEDEQKNGEGGSFHPWRTYA